MGDGDNGFSDFMGFLIVHYPVIFFFLYNAIPFLYCGDNSTIIKIHCDRNNLFNPLIP